MEENSDILKFVYHYFLFKLNSSKNEGEKRTFVGLLRRFETVSQIAFNSSYIFHLLRDELYKPCLEYFWGFLKNNPHKYFQHKDFRGFYCSLVNAYYEQCNEELLNVRKEVSLEDCNYRFHLYTILIKFCSEEVEEMNIFKSLNLSMGMLNWQKERSSLSPIRIKIDPGMKSSKKKKKKEKKNISLIEQFYRIRVYFPPRIPTKISTSSLLESMKKFHEKKKQNENNNFFKSPIFESTLDFFTREEEEEGEEEEGKKCRTDERKRSFSSSPNNEKVQPPPPPPPPPQQQQQQRQQKQDPRIIDRNKPKPTLTLPPITSFLAPQPPPPHQQQQKVPYYSNSPSTTRRNIPRPPPPQRRQRQQRNTAPFLPPPPRDEFVFLTVDRSITGGFSGARIRVPSSVIYNYGCPSLKKDIICKFYFEGHCWRGNNCDFPHITQKDFDKYSAARY